jgi:hypothetical protein
MYGRRLAGMLLVLLAATCLASGAASTVRSGLYGVVKAGPTQPVCVKGEPCYEPVRVTLVFARLATGKEAGRTRSSAEGRFRLTLPAGYYAVRTLERIGIDRSVQPRRVRVRTGRFSRVTFLIDTGIR